MRRYRAQFLCLLSRVLAERASTGSASLKTPRRKLSSKAEVRRLGKGVVPWRPWMVLKWNLFSLQFWPTTQENHPELSIVMVGRRLQRPFRSLSCGRTDWQKPRHSEFMFFVGKPKNTLFLSYVSVLGRSCENRSINVAGWISKTILLEWQVSSQMNVVQECCSTMKPISRVATWTLERLASL